MKCENCGHLRTKGYEYLESFCELEIADNPAFQKYDTGTGCSLTKKQRAKRCAELKERYKDNDFFDLWWDESSTQ